jgi:hypothetical protein
MPLMLRLDTSDLIQMLRCMKSPLPLLTVIVAIHFVGCGSSDGLTRVVVTGNVRLSGSPVVRGQIRFIPQVGTQGPVFIEEIHDGKYACRRSGGVPVGQHRVEILAWDPTVPLPTGPGQKTPDQLVPEKYNVDSELIVTLDDSSNPVAKDFDL